MTATKYSLTAACHGLLCEALRRYEAFAVRRDGKKWTLEDMTDTWTGLGSTADYRAAVSVGLMKHGPRAGTPQRDSHNTWWSLTGAGAEIVLAWHNKGFGCKDGVDDCELKSPLPPKEGEYTEDDLRPPPFTFPKDVRPFVESLAELMEYANRTDTGNWAVQSVDPARDGVFGRAEKTITAIVREVCGDKVAAEYRNYFNFGGHRTWLDSVEAAVQEALTPEEDR